MTDKRRIQAALSRGGLQVNFNNRTILPSDPDTPVCSARVAMRRFNLKTGNELAAELIVVLVDETMSGLMQQLADLVNP